MKTKVSNPVKSYKGYKAPKASTGPAPSMKKGGATKMQSGGASEAFKKLAPPLNEATYADKIAGAKKNAGQMKKGGSVKAKKK